MYYNIQNYYKDDMKSIREIASLSGVSTATVSRYINNNGNVSEQKANEIQKVIDKYGYIPNSNVNTIFKGTSNEIALIVQNVTNPFFSELVDGIMRNAEKNGKSVIVCNAMGDKEKEEKYFIEMMKKRIFGFIIVNTTDENIYLNTKVPIISIDKKIRNSVHIKVECDKSFCELLTQIDLIKEKIIYVESGKYNESSEQRKKSVNEFFKKSNTSISYAKVDDDNDNIETNIVNDLLKGNLIICWNDLVAHKIISTLTRSGKQVPHDIAVTGFDNIKINNFFSYKLTTIDQHISQICETAINVLNNYETQVTQSIIIKTNVVLGDTTRLSE